MEAFTINLVCYESLVIGPLFIGISWLPLQFLFLAKVSSFGKQRHKGKLLTKPRGIYGIHCLALCFEFYSGIPTFQTNDYRSGSKVECFPYEAPQVLK